MPDSEINPLKSDPSVAHFQVLPFQSWASTLGVFSLLLWLRYLYYTSNLWLALAFPSTGETCKPNPCWKVHWAKQVAFLKHCFSRTFTSTAFWWYPRGKGALPNLMWRQHSAMCLYTHLNVLCRLSSPLWSSISPKFIFSSIAYMEEWMLVTSYWILDLLHYLDDMITVGPPTSLQCVNNLNTVVVTKVNIWWLPLEL